MQTGEDGDRGCGLQGDSHKRPQSQASVSGPAVGYLDPALGSPGSERNGGGQSAACSLLKTEMVKVFFTGVGISLLRAFVTAPPAFHRYSGGLLVGD